MTSPRRIHPTDSRMELERQNFRDVDPNQPYHVRGNPGPAPSHGAANPPDRRRARPSSAHSSSPDGRALATWQCRRRPSGKPGWPWPSRVRVSGPPNGAGNSRHRSRQPGLQAFGDRRRMPPSATPSWRSAEAWQHRKLELHDNRTQHRAPPLAGTQQQQHGSAIWNLAIHGDRATTLTATSPARPRRGPAGASPAARARVAGHASSRRP